MKTSIYAMLAVILGVALITVVPGGISRLALPTSISDTMQLQNKGPPEIRENSSTILGGTLSPLQKNNTIADATKTTSNNTGIRTDTSSTFKVPYNPLNDLGYYSLWGLGLFAATVIYLISKRSV
jgi:hypothetical protein